jgi:hypothetical protein
MKTTIAKSSTALRAFRGALKSAYRAIGAHHVERTWRVGDTAAYLARGRGGQLVAFILTPDYPGGYQLIADTSRVPDIAAEYWEAVARRERKTNREN